ncbi:TIGR04104 family putative zinc finger protein [Planococcus ruber]|uniref:TIGR04104 family putative zinc finger protein n=1 Tax=Planococcus ruber TaxID=2027871 RepID=UPI001FEEB423|nr:hypothetical protein [Planococcus ruber]
MPTCQNCGQQWSWKNAFQKYIKLNKGMECPHCGEIQYVTSKSRKQSSAYSIPPLLILIFSNLLFDLSIPVYIMLAAVLFAATLVFYPFKMELTSKDEPLW